MKGVNKVTKAIGLSNKEVETVNKRLKQEGDWEGTTEEWKEWIQRLLMEDVGNF